MTVDEILTGLLEAEHAAVYAYGVLGARLDLATRREALAAFDAHRAARDELEGLLRDRGLDVPAAAPAYDVSAAGRPQALALAARVEDDLAGRWCDLVADAGLRDGLALTGEGWIPPARAVQGLRDSAVRATRWRRLAGPRPWTTALPGLA